MNGRTVVALMALLSAASLVEAGTRKSLVIAVDGLRTDGVLSASTPAFDRLIDGSFGGGSYRGIWAPDGQTIQDAPTSSAYNHCSIMTGVSGAKHGVASNDAAGLAAVDYAAYPHYITTLEQADASLNTAYLVTWGPDLAIVSGADYIKDGEDESNTQRVVEMLAGVFEDTAGDDGTAWALGTDPDAIFLFLDDVDGAGHGNGFGPWFPGYLAGVEEADSRVGRILAAIEARPDFASEQWQVVVTSDHGGSGTGHGGLTPNEETIPFIVTAQDSVVGYISGGAQNMDAAPTAIAHVLGDAAVPSHHDGEPRGKRAWAPSPSSLDASLLIHLGFDGDLFDDSGHGNHAQVGADAALAPVLHPTGGVCGGYLQINDPGGGPGASSYLTFGRPRDLVDSHRSSFTVSFWMRVSADQSGDSVVFSNKDWVSGFNPGVAILANEGDGDDIGLNIGDGSERIDIEPIDFGQGGWWLVVAGVDRFSSGPASAILFVGAPDGRVFLLADRTDALDDLRTDLPWNIGQDGTGTYPYNLNADLDEFRYWNRRLHLDHVLRLHADGLGLCSRRLLRSDALSQLSPPSPPLADILPLDSDLDFDRSVLPSEVTVSDGNSPLTFVALDGPGTLRVEKAGADQLRLLF